MLFPDMPLIDIGYIQPCFPSGYDRFLTRAISELGATVSLVTPEKPFVEVPLPKPATFEQWLATPEGQDVFHRIMSNKHSIDLTSLASYFDTVEDIQQKALVWLWQAWERDPKFSQYVAYATCPNHRAAILAKTAMKRGRCMYAKRRIEGRECQTDLEYADGEQRRSLLPLLEIRATDIEAHDKPTQYTDKHLDILNAVERVVQQMLKQYRACNLKRDGTPNKRFERLPLEHITRTIIEGYMYHYTDRYSQTGTFRNFCEGRGVTRGQIQRWRPLIFDLLREALGAYQPLNLLLQ